MGLDMYAYARPPRKRNSDDDEGLCEWRKHNRLQGWMQGLWESKGCPNANEDEEFNSVELQLTRADLYALEDDILNLDLPESNGFFWGSDSYTWDNEGKGTEEIQDDYYYKEQDLGFIEQAHKMLDKGYRVFYSCWY